MADSMLLLILLLQSSMRIWLKSFDKSTFFSKKTIFSLKKEKCGLCLLKHIHYYALIMGKGAQRQKLRGKNKCFIFAVNKFHNYET